MLRNTETITTTLVPPDPHPFDISHDYLQRATEGAHAWKRRERKIPEPLRRNVRILTVFGGIVLALLFVYQPVAALKPLAWFAWLLLPLLGESIMRIIEYRHDRHLKETVFDPRYNPNPRGFRKYARKYARYEAEVRKVYLSPDGAYHSNPACHAFRGQATPRPIPRWKAIYKNIRPCPRCGHVAVSPRRLPPPFGTGPLPPE